MTELEINKIFAKTDAALASLAKAQVQTDASLAKSQQQADERHAKTEQTLKDSLKDVFAEISKVQAETSKQIKAVNEQMGGIGKSQGMVAEEFFFNSLQANPVVGGIHYDSVTTGFKRKKGDKAAEIDLLLENGNSVAVTEVKYRVRSRDLEQVQKTLSVFRELFPQYENYKLYAGIAGFSFDEDVVEMAHEQGLFVLKRKGDVIEVDEQAMRAF